VILVDAFGLLALLLDEPAADDVEELLRDRSAEPAMTSVNVFEVIDYLVRRKNWPEEEVRSALAVVLDDVLRVLDVGADTAWRGALLRAKHYARGTCEISLADSILLASVGANDSAATADPSVASVARAVGIELVPLPDSGGRRP
jgi:PIN domain nuclease of toxin-antitoxin system